MVDDTTEGIQKALDENFAFIWDTAIMDSLIGQDCTHVGVKKSIYNAVTAYPARKQWPYLKLVNYL